MKKLKRIIINVMVMAMVLSSFGSIQGDESVVEAAGAYSLQVNKGTNVVTVFDAAGNPVKAMTCSTGYATPLGSFGICGKYRWWELDGPSYGQYCSRITGHVLFHSVWYYEKNPATQSTREFNKLGTTASHGCVRLTTADAKWIYDNCGMGTSIRIIAGSAANDPLGKPETIKVSTASKMDWDPTDPDEANPYNTRSVIIDVSRVPRTLSYGKKWTGNAMAKAYDSCGNDISNRLHVSGKINRKKLGKYTLTYSASDVLGRTAQASVVVEVKDTFKAKITGVKSKKTIEYNKTLNLKSKVKAAAVSGKKLTSKMKIYVRKPGQSKYKKCRNGKYKFGRVGTYKVKYTVKNPYNKKVTNKYMKVVVKDTKAPKLTGVTGETVALEAGTSANLMTGVRAKLVSGKDVTTRIKVTVTNQSTGAVEVVKQSNHPAANGGIYSFATPGTYEVVYAVSNPTGKKETKVTKIYYVKDTAQPAISGLAVVAQTATQGNSVSVFNGVTATLKSGGDVSTSLKADVVYVSDDGNSHFVTTISYVGAGPDATYTFENAGRYEITYTATNPGSGATTSQTVTYQVAPLSTTP